MNCLPGLPCNPYEYSNPTVTVNTVYNPCNPCLTGLCKYSSQNVCYTGEELSTLGISSGDNLTYILERIDELITSGGGSAIWGDITGILSNQTDLISFLSSTYYPNSNPNGYINSTALSPYLLIATAASTYVPLIRNLTINGVAQDLSLDRSWSVGTISSLNGLTGASQTFVNDTNVTIISAGTTHTLTWVGTLADGRIASASNWNTAYNNRIISLTTTGTSGAATLISNVLNIPQYQAAGSYVTSVSGTSNRITSTGGTTPIIDISATFEALLGKVANPLSQFAATTSTQLRSIISDETGNGALYFQNGDLGTPSAGVLTNATGLPLTTGVTGNLPVTNLNSGIGASASTFWRGDGTWVAVGGISGSGVANQFAIWNGASSITGFSELTYDGTTITFGKQVLSTFTAASGDPISFVSSRTLTGTGNAHGFKDSTIFARSAGTAYADFYASSTIGDGTSVIAYDHWVGFQSAGVLAANSSLSNWYGIFISPQISAGSTATNVYNLYAANGSGSGTVNNRYGLYIEALTLGNNRYGIWQQGATNLNVIKGQTAIGETLPDAKLHVYGAGTTSGTNAFHIQNFGGTEILRIYDSGNSVFGSTGLEASAQVQINSTTRGFLPPRMTALQAEAISSPAEGLMLYSTNGAGATITSKGWWGYDGAVWTKINDSGGGITNGAAANELMKSDGTNAVASGIFSTTAGNITLGTSLSGTARDIIADGSGSNINIFLTSKGTGTAGVISGSSSAYIQASGFQMLGTTIHNASITDAINNGITNALAIRHETTGTPVAGIGVGLQFEVETSAGNNEIGAIIQAVTTDVTSTSEDFDILFKTMEAGAAATERTRITNTGLKVGRSTTGYIDLNASLSNVHQISGGGDGLSQGALIIKGKDPTVTNVTGTFIEISAGNALSGNASGGDIILTPGTSSGTGIPGNLRIPTVTGSSGVATLVAGTVTVNTTSICASCNVFITSQVDGGTPGTLRISAKVANTSFTISSTSVVDTSTVGWMIVKY